MIDLSAFDGCDSLESVSFRGRVYTDIDAFRKAAEESCTVQDYSKDGAPKTLA